MVLHVITYPGGIHPSMAQSNSGMVKGDSSWEELRTNGSGTAQRDGVARHAWLLAEESYVMRRKYAIKPRQ